MTETAQFAPGEYKILAALDGLRCSECNTPFLFEGARCTCGGANVLENPEPLSFKQLKEKTGLSHTHLSRYLKRLRDLLLVTHDYHERKYSILQNGKGELGRGMDMRTIAISKIPNYLILNPEFAQFSLFYYYLGDLGDFEKILERRTNEMAKRQLSDILGLAKRMNLIPDDELRRKAISSRTITKIWSTIFPKLERILLIERIEIKSLENLVKSRKGKPLVRYVLEGGLPDYST